MRYLKLAQLYEEISSTTKRLEKTEILSNNPFVFQVVPSKNTVVIKEAEYVKI